MKSIKTHNISFFLLILAGIFLCLAVTYCNILAKAEKHSFSTSEEYDTVTNGLSFLNKMPIQFNVINKYFSGFSNVDNDDKEKIVITYAIKNNYGLVNCDNSSVNDICVSRYFLEESEYLANIFAAHTSFSREDVPVYVDGYGMLMARYIKGNDYYRIHIDGDANDNVLYSSFYKYYKRDDLYVFYLFQGYRSKKCDIGSKLYLYDFMSGDKVFTGVCDSNNNFAIEPDVDNINLQLYKYELKKDSNGEFYLYGYNPVNKYSI